VFRRLCIQLVKRTELPTSPPPQPLRDRLIQDLASQLYTVTYHVNKPIGRIDKTWGIGSDVATMRLTSQRQRKVVLTLVSVYHNEAKGTWPIFIYFCSLELQDGLHLHDTLLYHPSKQTVIFCCIRMLIGFSHSGIRAVSCIETPRLPRRCEEYRPKMAAMTRCLFPDAGDQAMRVQGGPLNVLVMLLGTRFKLVIRMPNLVPW
jgi:hypothetical protein